MVALEKSVALSNFLSLDWPSGESAYLSSDGLKELETKLTELRDTAKAADIGMLAYLIEMAVLEVKDVQARRTTESMIREHSAEDLLEMDKAGVINVEDALNLTLHSLKQSGEQAELALLEAGRLRRFLDNGARQIDDFQAETRKSILQLMHG